MARRLSLGRHVARRIARARLCALRRVPHLFARAGVSRVDRWQVRTVRDLPGGFREPSLAHLRKQMRAVVSSPAEAAARGRRARQDMTARFSLEAVGDVVMGRLADIGRHVGAAPARPATRSNLERLSQRY